MTIETHYLPVSQTAKLVRAALAKAFPGVKFSVRSSSYSGGCSVNVTWTDGPLQKAVEKIAGQFTGKGFDGSIDMAHTNRLWLMPDGTATVASDEGTEGSGGSRAAVRTWMPHPDAKLISTGAYIFCTRQISPDLKARAIAYVARRGGWQGIYMAQDEAHAAWLVAHRAVVRDRALFVLRDHA